MVSALTATVPGSKEAITSLVIGPAGSGVCQNGGFLRMSLIRSAHQLDDWLFWGGLDDSNVCPFAAPGLNAARRERASRYWPICGKLAWPFMIACLVWRCLSPVEMVISRLIPTVHAKDSRRRLGLMTEARAKCFHQSSSSSSSFQPSASSFHI